MILLHPTIDIREDEIKLRVRKEKKEGNKDFLIMIMITRLEKIRGRPRIMARYKLDPHCFHC